MCMTARMSGGFRKRGDSRRDTPPQTRSHRLAPTGMETGEEGMVGATQGGRRSESEALRNLSETLEFPVVRHDAVVTAIMMTVTNPTRSQRCATRTCVSATTAIA